MGMATTVAPKGLGAQDSAKKLAQWVDLWGQLLYHNPVISLPCLMLEISRYNIYVYINYIYALS